MNFILLIISNLNINLTQSKSFREYLKNLTNL